MRNPDPHLLAWLRSNTPYEHLTPPARRRQPHAQAPSSLSPADEAAATRIVIERLIRRANPRIRREIVTAHAEAWSRLNLPAHEVLPWMDALGVANAPKAIQCQDRGLTPMALTVRLGGRTAGSRIRGGESVDSVIVLAAELGVDLWGRQGGL